MLTGSSPRLLDDKLSTCGCLLHCLEEQSEAFPHAFVEILDQEGSAWQGENHINNILVAGNVI